MHKKYEFDEAFEKELKRIEDEMEQQELKDANEKRMEGPTTSLPSNLT